MSFKGFKKSIVRAPQNFRQKFHMGEITTDPVYADADRRFKEIEMETKKLSDESKRYFTAVNGMLDHQIEFSQAIEEIYKPISGRVSDPDGAVPEDNPEGIKAADQYREVVRDLKEELKPDLELIEKRIVEPAQQLLKVIQSIRKMATKRDHKQLDLDRRKRTYHKYESKKEPTAKDEERMYTAQSEMEVAQLEFDYYNDMLKNELPTLFQMQSDFIKPLFVSFYYMQLNVFYTLYNRMQELKIPYFDLSSDIVEAYNRKKGDIEERADAIGVTHFKVGHAKSKLEATRRRHAMMLGNATPGQTPGQTALDSLPAYSPPPTQYGQYDPYSKQPQQPQQYGSPQSSGYQSASSQPQAGYSGGYGGYTSPTYTSPTSGSAPGMLPNTAAPPAYGMPPPTPQSAPAPSETCTALYDYVAQQQGDLSFTAGAIIEVLERTSGANGWWKGRCNGQVGIFPGNYVKLN